jgi:hypothetical protein
MSTRHHVALIVAGNLHDIADQPRREPTAGAEHGELDPPWHRAGQAELRIGILRVGHVPQFLAAS